MPSALKVLSCDKNGSNHKLWLWVESFHFMQVDYAWEILKATPSALAVQILTKKSTWCLYSLPNLWPRRVWYEICKLMWEATQGQRLANREVSQYISPTVPTLPIRYVGQLLMRVKINLGVKATHVWNTYPILRWIVYTMVCFPDHLLARLIGNICKRASKSS